MQSRHRILFAIAALFLAGQAVHAQTGVADLRYQSPIPASITYVTIDSMWTTMTGMPTGDMATTARFRSVNELNFSPVDGGFDVTAVLNSLEGTTETPMGDMPMSASNVPPMTIRITATGANAAEMTANAAASAAGKSPGDLLGSSKSASGLLTLPGRELDAGETWSDTVKLSPEADGMKTDMLIVIHGTYEGDTVADGTTLNVLKIHTEMTMSMNGTVQGMTMTQQTSTTSDERVLWDSSRHYATSKDGVGEIRSETSMLEQGMTMVMTGRTRTITTAQPDN